MAKLMLEVPQEIVDAVRLPPAEVQGELLKELALALYRRGGTRISLASRFWLIPSGFRNSSERTSPAWTFASFWAMGHLLYCRRFAARERMPHPRSFRDRQKSMTVRRRTITASGRTITVRRRTIMASRRVVTVRRRTMMANGRAVRCVTAPSRRAAAP